MGCDIHAFIDYNKPGEDYVHPLSEELYLDRDYAVFSKLANVRNYDEDIEPISEPRGLPEKVSYIVSDENSLYISEIETNSDYCTKEDAENWVKCGASKYTDDHKSSVTNPDYHSHPWLSVEEYEQAIKELQTVIKYKLNVNYFAVLAAMKFLQDNGYEVRLVFWFDN